MAKQVLCQVYHTKIVDISLNIKSFLLPLVIFSPPGVTISMKLKMKH